MNDPAEQFLEMKFDSFFKEALDRALANQHLQVNPETAVYILGVMARELRNDPTTDQRATAEKAIAIRYREAMQECEFKALGDSSLVISGMWWPSLIRKLVDVDYYIAIGSRSYQKACELTSNETLAEIFEELAENFTNIVNVLTEATQCISISETNISDSAILRVYEIYIRTHNPFFKQLLRSLHIDAVPGTTTRQ